MNKWGSQIKNTLMYFKDVKYAFSIALIETRILLTSVQCVKCAQKVAHSPCPIRSDIFAI